MKNPIGFFLIGHPMVIHVSYFKISTRVESQTAINPSITEYVKAVCPLLFCIAFVVELF